MNNWAKLNKTAQNDYQEKTISLNSIQFSLRCFFIEFDLIGSSLVLNLKTIKIHFKIAFGTSCEMIFNFMIKKFG